MSIQRTIVLLVGKAGSGKSIVSTYLSSKNYIRLSFSSKLKDIISLLFNYDRNKLNGQTDEDRIWREKKDDEWSALLKDSKLFEDQPFITPRLLLQRIGTELFRNNLGKEFWINTLIRDIKVREKECKHYFYVIDDCRFVNEVECLKNNLVANFIVIKLVRDNENVSIPLHSSELELEKIKCDYVLKNNKSLENLYSLVDEICFK